MKTEGFQNEKLFLQEDDLPLVPFTERLQNAIKPWGLTTPVHRPSTFSLFQLALAKSRDVTEGLTKAGMLPKTLRKEIFHLQSMNRFSHIS